MEGFSFKDTDRFLPLKLGATAHDTLQEFIDIDVSAEDLVRILNRNQAYKDLFARFVNQKTRGKSSEGEAGAEGAERVSPTHRLISLLGMLGSRNLILSLRMHKAVDGAFPVKDDGTVDINAGDYVKFALELEELFLRNNLEYSESAYAAGVYFDWLKRLLSRHPSFKKGLESYWDHTRKRAQRTGLVGYFLAQHVRSLSPKQVLMAGMAMHGGKLLLACAFDDYAASEMKADESGATPLCRLLTERDRWGFAFEEVSSHAIRYFDIFKSSALAVRHAREPYVLKGGENTQYDLASVLYLADCMARSWKIPSSEKDPLFTEWSHPSLPHLKLSTATLTAVMKSAMAMR
jgi:hypothetical protein